MSKTNKYSQEVRERAVRLAQGAEGISAIRITACNSMFDSAPKKRIIVWKCHDSIYPEWSHFLA